MTKQGLRLKRFHRVGAAVHAVALSGDGEHLLVGSERGLRLLGRRGDVQYRLEKNAGAFSAVALSPRLDAGTPSAGLALERSGRLYRLDFSGGANWQFAPQSIEVAAVGIWEQRDDLYSLDYAPGEQRGGLIALGHHALGLTALDGRGQLLWRLGPREGVAAARRTWHAAISPDCRTVYAAPLGGAADPQQGEIIAIDAAVGKPVKSVRVSGRVALLAGLPAPLGVAAVLHQREAAGMGCEMIAFDADLRGSAWRVPCPPDVRITAIASAPGRALLVAGTNTGELWQIGAFTGRVLARSDLLFSSTVLSVAVAESGEIAAGLANGQVAFLEVESSGAS